MTAAEPHPPRMAVGSVVATCYPGNRFGLGVLVRYDQPPLRPLESGPASLRRHAVEAGVTRSVC